VQQRSSDFYVTLYINCQFLPQRGHIIKTKQLKMYKETIAVHCIIRRTDTVEQSPFSASKEIPEFYDNGKFVAAFTSTNQLSLCYAR
jgi:hypothetical protein